MRKITTAKDFRKLKFVEETGNANDLFELVRDMTVEMGKELDMEIDSLISIVNYMSEDASTKNKSYIHRNLYWFRIYDVYWLAYQGDSDGMGKYFNRDGIVRYLRNYVIPSEVCKIETYEDFENADIHSRVLYLRSKAQLDDDNLEDGLDTQYVVDIERDDSWRESALILLDIINNHLSEQEKCPDAILDNDNTYMSIIYTLKGEFKVYISLDSAYDEYDEDDGEYYDEYYEEITVIQEGEYRKKIFDIISKMSNEI